MSIITQAIGYFYAEIAKHIFFQSKYKSFHIDKKNNLSQITFALFWQDKAKQNKRYLMKAKKSCLVVYSAMPLQVRYFALPEKDIIHISHHMHTQLISTWHRYSEPYSSRFQII